MSEVRSKVTTIRPINLSLHDFYDILDALKVLITTINLKIKLNNLIFLIATSGNL